MTGSIDIKNSDLEVDADGVAIKNADFATALIRDPNGAINELKSVAPDITTDQIHVDAAGRVVIKNGALSARLVGRINPATLADNGICGFKCGAKPLEIGGGIVERIRRIDR